MEQNVKLDLTPIINELIKTQAFLMTLKSVLLNDEQKKEFDAKYWDNIRVATKDFINQNPSAVTIDEQTRKILEDGQ